MDDFGLDLESHVGMGMGSPCCTIFIVPCVHRNVHYYPKLTSGISKDIFILRLFIILQFDLEFKVICNIVEVL